MSPESAPLGVSGLIGIVMMLPSWAALRRRNRSRESSAVASSLSNFASEVRRRGVCLSLDEELLARARRLGIPEMASLEYARELPNLEPELLAAAVHRLALRLKRRVAFERKMLARTAPGRRRALIAAAACITAILLLSLARLGPPVLLLWMALAFTALGSALCWRVSRVEV